MKNNLKENKGITLVALIITIIVLVILAGVTIGSLINTNIFKKAEEAVEQSKNAEAKEQIQLAVINSYDKRENINFSKLKENLNKIEKISPIVEDITALPITVTVDGEKLEIKENGTVDLAITKITDTAGNEIPAPKGMYYVGGTIDNGVVISDSPDDENKGVDVTLVGNQFVWIPVTAKNLTYTRYAFTGNGTKQVKGELDSETNSYKINQRSSDSNYYTEAMPADEQESVTTYGGYYIARYEAGVEGYDSSKTTTENTESSLTWTGYKTTEGTDPIVVSKKGVQVWNYITRNKAKSIAEGMNIKNGTTKLCSSYAWDTALKYIALTNSDYPTNSIEGNYSYSGLKNTGSSTSVSNIYDMGGNVWEWATESYSNASNQFTYRGGRYGSAATDLPASYRSYCSTINVDGRIAFRVTLFM